MMLFLRSSTIFEYSEFLFLRGVGQAALSTISISSVSVISGFGLRLLRAKVLRATMCLLGSRSILPDSFKSNRLWCRKSSLPRK